VSRESELADLAAAAWAEVQRIMEIADPGAIDALPEGGGLAFDDRTEPPLVSFRFGDTTLSYDAATGAVLRTEEGVEQRAYDSEGRPLDGVIEDPGPGDPRLN
jgi:hypothetical protein